MAKGDRKATKPKYKVGTQFFESYLEPSHGISKSDWKLLQDGYSVELKTIDKGFLDNLLHNGQLIEG